MYKFKNILITGASSGLGKNLAINYAKKGAKIINISRNVDKMKNLNNELNNINNLNNIFYSADVSDYKKMEEIKNALLMQKIVPDVIINNAAGNFLCNFEDLSENGWKRIIDIVLNGSFNIYHIFGKELIKQKKSGVFLNISTNSSAKVLSSIHILDFSSVNPDCLPIDNKPLIISSRLPLAQSFCFLKIKSIIGKYF